VFFFIFYDSQAARCARCKAGGVCTSSGTRGTRGCSLGRAVPHGGSEQGCSRWVPPRSPPCTRAKSTGTLGCRGEAAGTACLLGSQGWCAGGAGGADLRRAETTRCEGTRCSPLTAASPGVGGGEGSLPQFPCQPLGKSHASSSRRRAQEELGSAAVSARGFYPQGERAVKQGPSPLQKHGDSSLSFPTSAPVPTASARPCPAGWAGTSREEAPAAPSDIWPTSTLIPPRLSPSKRAQGGAPVTVFP